MAHKHIAKTIKHGFDKDNNFIPVLYGCTGCDETSETLWVTEVEQSTHASHIEYTEGCFGCKVRTLELNTGDAGRADSPSQKKWDRELDGYAAARKQGIQPAGTTTKAVREAFEASDKLGKAYNAESMPAAQKITKQTAAVMKETGVA